MKPAEAAETGQAPTFDSSILEQLACPACFGNLWLAENAVACDGCGRIYPVMDGIPVLIAERATETRE